MSILRTLSAWGACSILACGAAMAQQPATPPAESLEVQQQAPAPAESETAATPTEAADCAESACETSSGSLIIVDRRGWRNRGLVYGPLDCTDGMHGKHGSTTTSGHFRHYGRAGVIRKGEAATPSGTTWTRHHGAQVSGCYSVTRGGAIYRYNQKAPVTDTTPRDIVRARQQWLIRSGAVQSARIVRKSEVSRPACTAKSTELPEPRAVIEVHKKKVAGPDAQLQARAEQTESTG
ncbi:MAG: hypothetical protein D8M59_06805 [Planctomycetes bacterium]|nr:hypothetical protein [Planctomycetota bacterium]NOG54387.1 hypothetical protein [Planctomycetota bacterium]